MGFRQLKQELSHIRMPLPTVYRRYRPPNWPKNEKASEDWLSFILKRHPSLSIRKPEQTSQARAAGFNKPVVDNLYDKLDHLFQNISLKCIKFGMQIKQTVLP